MSNEQLNENLDPLEILKTNYRSCRERLERLNSRKVSEQFPVDLWDSARLKARDEYFEAAVVLADFVLEKGE